MSEQEIFIAADHALLRVVEQITDEQWPLIMPADFPTTQQGPITLREVINYHAYDEAWVPDMLKGVTIAEAGSEKFKGDLLGEQPKDAFVALVETACASVRNLKDVSMTVHCSFGDYSASDYLKQITSFRGLRAYDIAKAIGLTTTLPDEVVQGLWQELEPVADEWRTYGVFGPRVDVPEDAPLQDRLLGLTGRRPE